MESSSATTSPRRDQPPPYKPPSPGDRLFFLLLTATATSVVYKSFPERFRGISALAVGSFGLYHSFGLTCECVQDTVNKIFGGFGGPGGSSGSGGGYWGWFPSWDTRSTWNIPRGGWQPRPSHTGSVDHGERQETRRGGGRVESDWDHRTAPDYRGAGRRSPSPERRSSPTSASVDRGKRQEKRRGGQPRTDAFGNEMKGWE